MHRSLAFVRIGVQLVSTGRRRIGAGVAEPLVRAAKAHVIRLRDPGRECPCFEKTFKTSSRSLESSKSSESHLVSSQSAAFFFTTDTLTILDDLHL